MPPLTLFRQFILRSLLGEKARSAVALLGIAAGVAVMVAIRLANSSVTETFEAAVDAVGGNTTLRIRGTAGRFDELKLRDLDALRERVRLSPVIETYAMVATDTSVGGADFRSEQGIFPRGELLQVLGVDVLLDFDFRDYQILRTGRDDQQSAREALSLLQDPQSVILTEKFLRRRGLRVGDSIRLVFASKPADYHIRGVLLDQGPAKTLDGAFALMDIAGAQYAADRLGVIDHVDVISLKETDLDELRAWIADRLPEGLVVEQPDASFGRTDTMLSAFQFNLEALSSIALIVGLFLIYNTLAVSVASRRREIGLLQAAGAGRSVILKLFLGEALLLTCLGLAIGLPLGRFLASFAVQGAAQTVETFYIAGIAESSASHLQLGISDILQAIGIVLPLAMLAAVIPAWDAASTPPVEAARGSSNASRLRWRLLLVSGVGLFATGWALTYADPIAGKPIFGFLAELLFMAAAAVVTPLALAAACWSIRYTASSLLPKTRTELRLASSNLMASAPRVSVSVAALGVSLAMMVAIAVMVGSFRDTMVYWLDTALSADLAVKPVIQSSAMSEARMSPQAIDAIEADEDVAETLWITARQLPIADQSIRLGVTEMDRAIRRAGMLLKAPSDRSLVETTNWSNSAMVSESYALRFKVGVGDSILLPSPAGNAQFRVAAVYYDYASNQGTVLIDAKPYRKWYAASDPDPQPSNLSIYLHNGADPNTVRNRILDRLGRDEQLYCVTNSEIRNEAMRIFESTFAVTYALQAIAIVIAGLGVASTLITLIYQRQRELGLLSLVGATFAQVRRVILWEAVILGIASQIVGVLLGLLLAYGLVYVINVQSFGWTIQFRLPWSFLFASTATVVGAAAMFGLYPAVKAASGDPLQTVRDQ